MVGLLLWAASAPAQDRDVPPSSPAWADSAADLYRQLFRLQVAVSNLPEGPDRDRLVEQRERLIQRISQLHEAENPEDLRRRSLRWEGDSDAWVEELQELGIDLDLDWDRLSGELSEGLGDLSEGLEELSRQLGNLELEVGPDRIRLADRENGSNVTLVIPGEIREGIVQSLRVVREELEGALEDSLAADFNWERALSELGGLAEEHAEMIEQNLQRKEMHWPSRREPPNVIANTVVKVMDDFVVERRDLVQGDVIVVGGSLDLRGRVLGNVVVVFGETRVERTAEVQGSLYNVGGSLEEDGNPDVNGNIVDVNASRFGMGVSQGWWNLPAPGKAHWAILLHLVWIAGLLILVLLVHAFLGNRMEIVGAAVLEQPLRNLLTGSLWLIAVILGFVVVGMVLAITIIGIPVVFVVALALLCLLLAAYFVASRILGTRVLTLLGRDTERAPWVETVVGVLVLELPMILALAVSSVEVLHDGAVMLRGLGVVLKFLTLCVGVGAVAATRLGQSAPVPSTSAQEAPALGAGAS